MKCKLVFLALMLLLMSCGQIYYVTPQPQKGTVVRAFIPELHGTYADSSLTVVVQNDHLIINNDTFRLSTKTPIEGDVLVKYYKRFYFASFRDSIYFTVYMANFYENKLALYTLNADERSIGILKRFVKVDTLDADSEHYLINPTRKEFDQLIDDEIFEVLGVLEKK